MKKRMGLIGMAAGLALVAAGALYAGGADCNHGKAVQAGHDHGAKGHGAHCALAKNVTKNAKITDNGAVVILEGKNEEAIKAIHAHLGEHENGAAGCEGCPMGQEGVEVNVDLTDKGGKLVFTGSTPEAVKSVHEWAKKPAGSCCSGKEHKS